jgi:ABC-type Mn2+/Zn2+ transport system ATPase subunit
LLRECFLAFSYNQTAQFESTCSARSFMRFKSGKVKFVAVDEPSSALDAEGELKLFERLIAAREGKTMVFVTHRFGHLTKHADQIMCVLLLICAKYSCFAF